MSHPRLGWLGGTFDPIHCGHLDVARAARAALKLETVHLVPTGVPPHRDAPFASARHRLAMAKLAAATHDWLQVSDIELTAPGPSYTMDTLDSLARLGVDLRAVYVITGADAFAEIMTWRDAPQLLDRCPFVVVSRPGYPAPALRRVLPALAGKMCDVGECELASQPSIFLVDAPTAPITSTEVRACVSDGRPLAGLVPATVADYIEKNDLYQGVA